MYKRMVCLTLSMFQTVSILTALLFIFTQDIGCTVMLFMFGVLAVLSLAVSKPFMFMLTSKYNLSRIVPVSLFGIGFLEALISSILVDTTYIIPVYAVMFAISSIVPFLIIEAKFAFDVAPKRYEVKKRTLTRFVGNDFINIKPSK